MIKCKNGTVHTHQTVDESRACWKGTPLPSSAPLSTAPIYTPPVSAPSSKMIWKVGKVGGDQEYAKSLSFRDCMAYIDRLIKEQEGAGVEATDKEKALLGMLNMVPNGYFAVQKDENTALTFLRLSRPAKGKYKDAVKLQTQHSETLKSLLIVWPSGKVWKNFNKPALEYVELLVTGHREAAKKYARETHHCMSCGKQLTDPRSRHYGVGPECEVEKDYGWLIAEIDEENGASFETLFARGLVS